MCTTAKKHFAIALLAVTIAGGSAPQPSLGDECLPSAVSTLSGADTRIEFERMPSVWKKKMQRALARRKGYFGDLTPFFNRFAHEYGTRWIEGDEAAHAWVELGAKIEVTSTGRALVRLPDLETLFVRYNEHIQTLIDSGKASESDVIRPALAFKSKNTKRIEYLFVRPGIDAWPDPAKFDLLIDLPTFAQGAWASALESGKIPVGFETFGTHDASHVTEMYNDPELSKATRDHFRWYRNLSARLRLQVEQAHRRFGEDPNHPPPYSWAELHYLRTSLISEVFALPNLKEKATIRGLMPEYFADAGPKTLPDAIDGLRSMPPEDLVHRIEGILAERNRITIRQGGSIRDPYNEREAVSYDSYREPLDAVGASGKVKFQNSFDIVEMHRNSLLGLIHDIEYLYRLRQAKAPRYNANLEALLLDRVARFQLGMKKGLDLELTPAQVVRDNTALNVSTQSKTYQFLQSFVPEGGMLWNAFLSPRATTLPLEPRLLGP